MTEKRLKRYIKRVMGIVLMIAFVIVFVVAAQAIVANDGSSESLILLGFNLEEKDSLDIVLMGASELMNDYSAPEVYKEFGYTSYPYAFAANPVPLWGYELKEIENRQHPQILIIEINGALYLEDKYIHSKERVRFLGDNLSMSRNRLEYAHEMSDNPMETLFPIIKYHYRWKDVDDDSVKDRYTMCRNGYARLRSAMTPLYQTEFNADNIYPADDSVANLNPNAEAELKSFLELCKESEIPHIIFAEFPHILASEKAYNRHQRVNKAAEIIRQEGFEFIDFTKEIGNIGLEYQVDFFDTHHMVATGQQKMSDYIGKVAKEKYGIIPKQQSDKNTAEWEDSVEMIEKFYKQYATFTSAHSDKPHDKIDHDLSDTYRTLKELDTVTP